MDKKIVLDQMADSNVILVGDLTLEETAAMLDSLFKVEGTNFDFHKTIDLSPQQTTELYESMIEAGRQYIFPLAQISPAQLKSLGVPGLYITRHSNQNISYSQGEMTGEELVGTGFTQAHMRLEKLVLNDGTSPAIISFETSSYYSSHKYRCKFKDPTEIINLRGPPSNHRVFNHYCPGLTVLLQQRLSAPEFKDLGD